MITIEYRCEDGTPFPVHFADEEEAALPWRLSREHGRDPRTPLGDALERAGLAGAQRAYEEVGMVLPPVFGPSPDAGGFPYFSDAPMSAEYLTTMTQGCGRLVQLHGSALGIWRDYCLPRAKQAWADIDAAGEDVALEELAELQAYGQQMTMIPAYVCGNDMSLLAASISHLFGADANLVAYELAQGFDNVTLQADQRLWELGRVAREDPEALGALSSADAAKSMAALRAAGGSGIFFAAVDAFLADYGMRAEGWDIAYPTWDEQADGFWAQVAHMASDAMPEPVAAVSAGAARRAALTAEIEGRLASDDEASGRFARRLARIEPYVFVREERALWQVALVGALRHAALRRGRRLADTGAIAIPEDVLYLTPAEVASPPGDARDVVFTRRAQHVTRCGLIPPAVIGARSTATATAPDGGGVLRGVAASRGAATGRARVILDLDDADRLEPGDVLVCVMTSPPWTALFGIAAAVVVETGDIGSHPAIAAREYGIPCVLGVPSATRTIPDGVIVTVDGGEGTVEVAGL